MVAAISAGLELDPLAARIAGLIVAATATDVCFVHVLDDGGSALTLAGATPPFDAVVGQVHLLLGEGVTGWVARNCEPVTITDHKEADPRYRYFPELRGGEFTSMASVPMASRYRLTQEALQNVVKHSGATAGVVLRCDPGLVSLGSDGAGFHPTPRRAALASAAWPNGPSSSAASSTSVRPSG